MVELEIYFPWYINTALLVGFPILFALFFIILGKKLHWFEDTVIASVAISAFTGILIAMTLVFSIGETKTYDNPIDAVNSGYSLENAKFNEAHFKNKIVQNSDISQITLHKVNVRFWDNDDKQSKDLFEKFSNGDLVRFTGIKNGREVEGSVYFTNDSIHIIVDSTYIPTSDTKNKSQDEIIIPTN